MHPLVLLSILDHHIRREGSQDRVIGALLGTVANGVVEVTDAFGVHHSLKGRDSDEVRCWGEALCYGVQAAPIPTRSQGSPARSAPGPTPTPTPHTLFSSSHRCTCGKAP